MTCDEQPAGERGAADAAIDAARVALAFLDGHPVPDVLPSGVAHYLVVTAASAIRITAMAAGNDGEGADKLVRSYFEQVLDASTFIANGFSGEPHEDPLAI